MATAAAQDDSPDTAFRLSGPDRFATAAAIANRVVASTPNPTGTVYLARSDVFADALAAGTLTDGPVLLTPPCGRLPGSTRDAIVELEATRVVALGGDQAVCDDLLDEAAALTGAETDRIAGASRYETAVEIVKHEWPDGSGRVYVASGADSPDAVAGGTIHDGPVLLVPPAGAVPDEVLAEIARLDPDTVVGLGGPVAIADETFAEAAAGRTALRYAGGDRYETATLIAEASHPSAPVVYLARADLFADAVAGGALPDGPILLVPSCGDLPQVVASTIHEIAPLYVAALGGPGAICHDILDTAAALVPDPAAARSNDDVVLSPHARVVTAEDSEGLVSFDGRRLVVSEDPTGGTRSWRPGNVVVGPASAATPAGLLHRVVARDEVDGRVAYSLEPATLADVVLEGELTATATPGEVAPDQRGPNGDVVVTTPTAARAMQRVAGAARGGSSPAGGSPTRSPQAGTAADIGPCSLTADANAGISPGFIHTSIMPNLSADFGCTESTSLALGPVDVTGSVHGGVNVDLDAKFTLPNTAVTPVVGPIVAATQSELNHLEFLTTTTAELGVRADWSGAVDRTWERSLLGRPIKLPTITVWAGPVPVVITNEADLLLHLGVDASASAWAEYAIGYWRQTGLRVDDHGNVEVLCDDGDGDADCTNNTVQTQRDAGLEGEVGVDAWLGVQPTTSLYGLADVWVRPKVGMQATASWQPPSAMSGSIDGYIAGDVGAHLGAFGLEGDLGPYELARWDHNLWSYPGDEPLPGTQVDPGYITPGWTGLLDAGSYHTVVDGARVEFDVDSQVEVTSSWGGYHSGHPIRGVALRDVATNDVLYVSHIDAVMRGSGTVDAQVYELDWSFGDDLYSELVGEPWLEVTQRADGVLSGQTVGRFDVVASPDADGPSDGCSSPCPGQRFFLLSSAPSHDNFYGWIAEADDWTWRIHDLDLPWAEMAVGVVGRDDIDAAMSTFATELGSLQITPE